MTILGKPRSNLKVCIILNRSVYFIFLTVGNCKFSWWNPFRFHSKTIIKLTEMLWLGFRKKLKNSLRWSIRNASPCYHLTIHLLGTEVTNQMVNETQQIFANLFKYFNGFGIFDTDSFRMKLKIVLTLKVFRITPTINLILIHQPWIFDTSNLINFPTVHIFPSPFDLPQLFVEQVGVMIYCHVLSIKYVNTDKKIIFGI